jgi:hypothetical protein
VHGFAPALVRTRSPNSDPLHPCPRCASLCFGQQPMPLTVGVDWMLVSLPEPESRQPIFVIRNCRM